MRVCIPSLFIILLICQNLATLLAIHTYIHLVSIGMSITSVQYESEHVQYESEETRRSIHLHTHTWLNSILVSQPLHNTDIIDYIPTICLNIHYIIKSYII